VSVSHSTTPESNVASGISTDASAFFARPFVWGLYLVLLIGIGIVRIVSAYHVFNHMIDEPSHLACSSNGGKRVSIESKPSTLHWREFRLPSFLISLESAWSVIERIGRKRIPFFQPMGITGAISRLPGLIYYPTSSLPRW